MQQLTESERAYRRGCLQALEFILADIDTSSREAMVDYLATWTQCLKYGRNSLEVKYLGTYLDSVREDVRKTRNCRPIEPLDVVNSLIRLPRGEFIDPDRAIYLLYTNWENRTSWRKVVPLNKPLSYDTTPHHTEKQWLMECWDMDKHDYRVYALLHMHMILCVDEYDGLTEEQKQSLVNMYAIRGIPGRTK